MIAPRCHGRIPLEKEEDYLDLMRENALPDYRSTEGNLGTWVLHRREGDIVHIETFTLWEDEAAIRRFMGDDMERAQYYDPDGFFLLELEPNVVHFEVLA